MLTTQRLERLSRFTTQLTSLPISNISLSDQIEIECECGTLAFIKVETLTLAKTPVPYRCKLCRCNSPEFKIKVAGLVRERWASGVYDADVMDRQQNEERKTVLSAQSLELWQDREYREKVINSVDYKIVAKRTKEAMVGMGDEIAARNRQNWVNPIYRERIISALRGRLLDANWLGELQRLFSSEDHRSKISAALKEKWKDPVYRLSQAVQLSRRPKVSSTQLKLYSMLDELEVPYYREYNDRDDDRECRVEFYTFDCVVPRPGHPTLLVECQGDYWHSIPANIRRDKAKASYIKNNFEEQYELVCLWEHEFKNPLSVIDKLLVWLDREAT